MPRMLHQKETSIQKNTLISANTQPGSKEIPEGAGNPAMKASTCKRLPSSQDRRGDRREAGDRPYAWSNICSSAKLSEDLGHQFH